MEIAEELEEFFGGLNVQITIYPGNTIRKFVTLRELYDFIKGEYKFWGGCTVGQASNIRARFVEVNNYLETAITGLPQNNSNNYLQSIQNAVNSLNLVGFPNIYSTSSYGVVRQNIAFTNCTLK